VDEDFLPKNIYHNHNYSCVVGAKGELLESGSLPASACDKAKFTKVAGLNGEVRLVSCASEAVMVVLKDNTVWYKGESRSYHFPGDSHKASFT